MKGICFFIAIMLFAFTACEEMCCVTCTDETTKKYYSIDTVFNRCGECCIDPDKSNIYLGQCSILHINWYCFQ